MVGVRVDNCTASYNLHIKDYIPTYENTKPQIQVCSSTNRLIFNVLKENVKDHRNETFIQSGYVTIKSTGLNKGSMNEAAISPCLKSPYGTAVILARQII